MDPLAPEPLAVDGAGGMAPVRVPVRWAVAEDGAFRRVVLRGVEQATPGVAHSVHVEVRGLRPARTYFYRFAAGDEISPVGRTRTATEPRSTPGALADTTAPATTLTSWVVEDGRPGAQPV